MEHKYHYGYDHKSKSCIIANIFASGFTIKFHHVKKKKKNKKREEKRKEKEKKYSSIFSLSNSNMKQNLFTRVM